MFQSDGLQPEDLYKFNIQDTNSIFRDFNFNSTIPSDLSSTMAIVAQDPRSIGDVESVTANALNKDLTSRFSEFSTAYDYTGKMSNVAIWNSDQSLEISNIYNSGVPGDLSSLSPLHWYRFEEGSGTTATASGTGGNNGTIIGATY